MSDPTVARPQDPSLFLTPLTVGGRSRRRRISRSSRSRCIPESSQRRIPPSVALALLLAVSLGCAADPALGPSASAVRFTMAVRVPRIASPIADTTATAIEIAVGYRRGSQIVPLPVQPSRVELEPDTSEQEVVVAVEITECLGDPQPERPATGEGGCALVVELRLLEGSTVLDVETLDSDGGLLPGDDVTLAISLGPPRLTIAGGGPGTGSGTVTAVAEGGQPPLVCVIANGVADEASCGREYPQGTSLSLTTSEGLRRWDGICTGTGPCEIVLDDDRDVTATFAIGSLAVTITGLPEGIPADVTVTGPGDFTQSLIADAVLTDLLPGDYDVSAPAVTSGEVTYVPDPATQTAIVADGETTDVTITYRPSVGSLQVSITGLPSGVPAAVVVTGPDGFRLPLTGSQLLLNLVPGRYQVAAASVTSDGVTYAPDRALQTVDVVAGATTTVGVRYSAQLGSLTVSITGLPSDVAADVTVTGPFGFAQSLTASATFTDIPTGPYTITAFSVEDIETETQYDPDPPTQTVPVRANATTPAQVVYSCCED